MWIAWVTLMRAVWFSILSVEKTLLECVSERRGKKVVTKTMI